MKLLIVAVALVATTVATVYDVYPTKYDNLNIDEIIQNKRLFDNYVLCLLKKGKCNEAGAILRDILPEALMTGCKKCNEVQRAQTKKVIKFLVKNRNSDWKELLGIYDPRGEYRAQYAEFLEKV